uniref:Uncharacterized protein n=1 Tax=Anguilla anguilla TaxID=7936 RepID=A0A0E9PL11_ANGAN
MLMGGFFRCSSHAPFPPTYL